MNDWNTEVAGQYELNVESMRKGRGAWIFETDRGLKLLKEYRGSVKRLEFEELVLGAVAGAGSLRVDQYVRNKEGELLSTASDGIRYVVKDWFSDRECDLKDTGEILSAVRQIAVLHKLLRKVEPREEWNMKSMVSPPLFMAMEKHNRELKKARAFIRGKQQKNEFELCVIASFEPFYQQAVLAAEGMKKLYPGDEKGWTERYSICHGELNQHLFSWDGIMWPSPGSDGCIWGSRWRIFIISCGRSWRSTTGTAGWEMGCWRHMSGCFP